MTTCKKRIISALIALMMVFSATILSSCGEEPEYPVTVGGITVNSEPHNAVILDKNTADIISCIGYDVKMSGRSDEVDQKGFKVVPSVGTAAVPSVSAIEKLNADIVFANDALDPTVLSELEGKGITVVSLEPANTPKQLKNLYCKLGMILGGKNEGKQTSEEAFDDLYNTYKELRDAAENSTNTQITVCYLYMDNGVLKTTAKGSWGNTMLSYTGTFNVFQNETSDTVDPEMLRRANPAYIFCDCEEVVEYLKTSDVLGHLDALNGKTVVVPYSDFMTQGYTGLSALRTILNTIFPSGDD